MALVVLETAQVMKAWEAWYGELGAAVVDPGYPQLRNPLPATGL